MTYRPIFRNNRGSGDLGPALFFILFIICFYALIIAFSPSFFTTLNNGFSNNSTAGTPPDPTAGFLGSIALGAIGFFIGLFGGYKALGALGLVVGGPLGFVGLTGAYYALDAAGFAEIFNTIGTNLLRIITLDVPMLNDAGEFGMVIKVLMAIFFIIAGVWIARRVVLG